MSAIKSQNKNYVESIKPKASTINLRKAIRVDGRLSEGLQAKINFNNVILDAKVFDFSSTGASFIIDLPPQSKLKPLDNVEVKINLGKKKTYSGNYIVCWIDNYKYNKKRIGLRTNVVERPSSLHSDPNISNILSIPQKYPITGYIYKDLFFNEKSIISLKAISSKKAYITVLDGEAPFFVGMKIEILFSLQSSNSEKMRGHIENIISTESDKVDLLIETEELSKSFQSDIVNHLIQDSLITIEQIRNAGFEIKNISNNFRFRFVRSHEEYLKVLDLRYSAYKSVGKVSDNKSPQNMIAPLDHISRILIATHGSKIIASVAMSFPPNNDITLDTERAIGQGYPSYIPKKDNMIEVSRLCTDLDYRRGDLLLRIFEHMYKVFAASDREYLITSTDDTLWPLYKKLGFKKTGLNYEHPDLNRILHHIIIIHRSIPIAASNISLLKWNYLYREMTDFLVDRGIIKYSLIDYIKIKIYSLVGKIIKIRIVQKY